MNPLALWPLVVEHQRSLLAEAEGERLAHLARLAAASRRDAAHPGPLRLVAVVTGRLLSTTGRAAIAASCRLETFAADCPQ